MLILQERWTKFCVIYIESPSSFTCRHPIFSPSFIVKALFSYLISKLYMCCVHVCAHVCLCVTMLYMHTWRPESRITCLSSSIHHHVFGDSLPQNLEVTFGARRSGQHAQGSSCCYLLALRRQVCIHTWHFYMDSGIWLLDLTPAH